MWKTSTWTWVTSSMDLLLEHTIALCLCSHHNPGLAGSSEFIRQLQWVWISQAWNTIRLVNEMTGRGAGGFTTMDAFRCSSKTYTEKITSPHWGIKSDILGLCPMQQFLNIPTPLFFPIWLCELKFPEKSHIFIESSSDWSRISPLWLSGVGGLQTESQNYVKLT